jgi:hypothetical protein
VFAWRGHSQFLPKHGNILHLDARLVTTIRYSIVGAGGYWLYVRYLHPRAAALTRSVGGKRQGACITHSWAVGRALWRLRDILRSVVIRCPTCSLPKGNIMATVSTNELTFNQATPRFKVRVDGKEDRWTLIGMRRTRASRDVLW